MYKPSEEALVNAVYDATAIAMDKLEDLGVLPRLGGGDRTLRQGPYWDARVELAESIEQCLRSLWNDSYYT